MEADDDRVYTRLFGVRSPARSCRTQFYRELFNLQLPRSFIGGIIWSLGVLGDQESRGRDEICV